MTLFQPRTSALALAACALTGGLALSGCSSGQISQSANQMPAVNGALTWVGSSTSGIALRNVHMRVTLTSDYVQPGSDVELIFLAVNESPDQGDRLVSITSDLGTVSLTGGLQVPPAGTLVVGTPDGQPSALKVTEGASTANATIRLTKKVTNGLTYPFRFTFERSGSNELLVPISAGEAPGRGAEASTGTETDAGGH